MMTSFSTLGRRKQSPNKWRGGNEQRFMGDGQTFKGKLIGVLEVQEARGDRMCQDALLELKTAIKASGEHKQKVLIHIAVDGLKIRDEKTGDCLYHHPVHKISFIAQDLSDSRAFGYIYGSPENGHRFFGIKTEKAASQVVVAMRDLFQVVFELKKKEMDDAKQQMNKENRDVLPHHPNIPPMSVATFPEDNSQLGAICMQQQQQQQQQQQSALSVEALKMMHHDQHQVGGAQSMGVYGTVPGPASELAGLQNELEGIQAGIHQINKLTPTAPLSFGTQSMLPIGILQPTSHFPVQQPQASTVKAPSQRSQRSSRSHGSSRGLSTDPFGAAPFLPPPPPSKSSRYQHLHHGHDGQNVYGTLGHPRLNIQSSNDRLLLQQHQQQQLLKQQQQQQQQQQQHQQQINASQFQDQTEKSQKAPQQDDPKNRYAAFDALCSNSSQVPTSSTGFAAMGFENSFTQPTTSSAEGGGFKGNIYSHTLNPKMMNNSSRPSSVQASMESSLFSHSGGSELFTDLDPLGMSKSKPYYERKEFFADFSQKQASAMQRPTSEYGSDSPLTLNTTGNYNKNIMTSSAILQNREGSTLTQSLISSTVHSGQPRQPPSSVAASSGDPDSSGLNRSGSGRPLYGYIQGFGFSDYLTESHPSDRNTVEPSNQTFTSSANQDMSAWESQDDPKSNYGETILNPNQSAQDNIYEVCGEGSSSQPPVQITVQGSPKALQVNLPADGVEEEMQDLASGGYGSIPHLDASPRRYRYIDGDECLQSDSPSVNLSVPTHRQGSKASPGALESSDSPPKLPERPPKTLHTGAPPPLPPKKPLSQQSSKTSIKNANGSVAMMAACFAESVKSDDIYDFPPDPMIGNISMNQEEAKQCINDILKAQPQASTLSRPIMPDLGSVTIEELSRMSVMELNEKMTAGLIPEELKGMSIFELVDFVAKQMKLKKDLEEKAIESHDYSTMSSSSRNEDCTATPAMKPSFSDNFVAEKLVGSPQTGISYNQLDSECGKNVDINIETEQTITNPTLATQNIPNANFNEFSAGQGFEDDFAHFQLPTSSISGRGSSVAESLTDHDKETPYDKYAVFRELQLEEEMLKGWKTPSLEDNIGSSDQLQESNKSIDLMNPEGDRVESPEHPICSSEGSPRSRSDTGSVHKSVSDDQPSFDGTLDDIKIGSEAGGGSLDALGSDSLSTKRESQIPIFFAEENNGDENSDDDDNESKNKIEECIEVNGVDSQLLIEENVKMEPVEPDVNKFEHSFEEAFGPAGDLTITKDWTTFDDGPMELQSTPNQQSQIKEHISPRLEQEIECVEYLEDHKREEQIRRLSSHELRQQQQLFEEHNRIQEAIHQQHALKRELNFHQQELQFHEEELHLQQHQHQLKYHLLDETTPTVEDPVGRRRFPDKSETREGTPCVAQQVPYSPALCSAALQVRRQPEESYINPHQYSSSDGSGNNSPMMRMGAERRFVPPLNHRGSHIHYANTHSQSIAHHHPTQVTYATHHQHSSRCLENHHWEMVAQVTQYDRPYEDPRYQPEFMSSFGNGGKNRGINHSRQQSSSSEMWNSMDEERKQAPNMTSRVMSRTGMHSGEASPFNDNFTGQARGSPASGPPMAAERQISLETGSWNEDSSMSAQPAVNGRRSVGQNSCPGDYVSDIFDATKDILAGASFKVLAKVIPNQTLMEENQLAPPYSADFDPDIPKSNSVNIFSIKDDPFDDEFFK